MQRERNENFEESQKWVQCFFKNKIKQKKLMMWSKALTDNRPLYPMVEKLVF